MTASASEVSPIGHAPIGHLLLRIAAELDALSNEVDVIDHIVGNLITAGHPDDRGNTPDLQKLDVLGQHISALAQFLKATAADLPPGWVFDPRSPASDLRLHDLAQRLAASGPASGPASGSEQNALDMGEPIFF